MAAKKENPSPASNHSPRKTRSMTSGKRVQPPPAKPKAGSKKPKLAAEKAGAGAKGKGKMPASAKGEEAKGTDDAKRKVFFTDTADASSKNIIIEACKQCNSFKRRAEEAKDGLESALTDITVVINPEKPRRGCFEIRKASGEIFVSLLDLKRPFKLMKDLDMGEVIEDIIEKIQ